MSVVATPAPMRRVGPVRRLVRSLRPVAGLLRPYRALFAGGVATNLMVHVCTFGAAVAGAVLIGEALDGSPSSELWPFVWVIVILAVPIARFGWLEVVVVHVMAFRLIDEAAVASPAVLAIRPRVARACAIRPTRASSFPSRLSHSGASGEAVASRCTTSSSSTAA